MATNRLEWVWSIVVVYYSAHMLIESAYLNSEQSVAISLKLLDWIQPNLLPSRLGHCSIFPEHYRYFRCVTGRAHQFPFSCSIWQQEVIRNPGALDLLRGSDIYAARLEIPFSSAPARGLQY